MSLFDYVSNENDIEKYTITDLSVSICVYIMHPSTISQSFEGINLTSSGIEI